jgi:ribosome-associated translation inhibitor RaiA
LAIGASAGFVGGGTLDLDKVRIGSDFIDDVAEVLLPNKAAVVAEIEEDSTTPVDTRMEAIGGTVFRRSLSEAKHTLHDEHVAAMKADLAQMKAEHARAHADRKAKLQEKINQLDSKLQAQLQKAKERREAAEREAQAKAELLKAKAAVAKAKAAQTHI